MLFPQPRVTSDLVPEFESCNHGRGHDGWANQFVTPPSPLFHGFWHLSSLTCGFCGEFRANPMISRDRGGGGYPHLAKRPRLPPRPHLQLLQETFFDSLPSRSPISSFNELIWTSGLFGRQRITLRCWEARKILVSVGCRLQAGED